MKKLITLLALTLFTFSFYAKSEIITETDTVYLSDIMLNDPYTNLVWFNGYCVIPTQPIKDSLSFDQSINGNLLSIDNNKFDMGISIIPNTTIVYLYNIDYKTFKTVIGLDDESVQDTLLFEIYLNAEKIYGNTLVNGQIDTINLEISNDLPLKSLALTVEPVNYNTSDTLYKTHADWCINLLTYDDVCTGIDEGDTISTKITENYVKQIKIYPNPATDFVNISLSNKSDINVEIYNIKGSLIKNYKDYTDNANIKITDLSKGVYIMKFVIDNKFEGSSKLIVK